MSLTQKNYGFSVDGHWVEVTGSTRPVHPEWSLAVDGETVDSQTRSGEFELVCTLPNGKKLTAQIDQGGFGSVELLVLLDGVRIQKQSGFLL